MKNVIQTSRCRRETTSVTAEMSRKHRAKEITKSLIKLYQTSIQPFFPPALTLLLFFLARIQEYLVT